MERRQLIPRCRRVKYTSLPLPSRTSSQLSLSLADLEKSKGVSARLLPPAPRP